MRWRCCGVCAHIYDIGPGDVFWAASDVGLGGRPLLHRLWAAAARGDDRALRGQAGGHARSRARSGGWSPNTGSRRLFTAPTAIRAIRKEDPDGAHLAKLRPVRAALSVPGRRTARPRHLPLGVGEAGHPGRRPLVADRDRLGDCRQSDGRRTASDQARIADGADARLRRAHPATATAPQCDAGEEGAICVKLPLPPGTLPTLWGDDDRYVGVLSVRPSRLLPDRRRRLHRRRRLPVRDGPHRRRHQRCGTPAVDRRHRSGAGHASGGGRVRGDRRRRRDQGPGAARLRRAQGGRIAPKASPTNWSQLVRDEIGAVAAFRLVDVVPALPKTRSGKILRKTMRGIAARQGRTGAVDHRGPVGTRKAETHSAGLTGTAKSLVRGPGHGADFFISKEMRTIVKSSYVDIRPSCKLCSHFDIGAVRAKEE